MTWRLPLKMRVCNSRCQDRLFCATPMVPLSRAVGCKKVLKMLFTCEFISAQETSQFGLVNKVVPLFQ
ncbi:MAG TPA: hypothetical protein ENG35_01050 [Desulfobacteraceae bacterium]|nr:hypothetical protein [Desulfobacteraceae bacterium]